MGASSDGKGKGITAPNPVGQRLALERACCPGRAGPRQVELFECHGTSTVVGDKIEVETLAKFLRDRSQESATANIGSVKSNIGHLKSAAGAASLIKTALAIHHNQKPPSINYSKPRSDVNFDGLTVQQDLAAWKSAHRCAGVSAFGFGGTNFHVVLEQPPQTTVVVDTQIEKPAPSPLASAAKPAPAVTPPVAPSLAATPKPTVGIPDFLWAVSASDTNGLMNKIKSRSTHYDPTDAHRMVMTKVDDATMESYTERVCKTLERNGPTQKLNGGGIFIEEGSLTGKVAFLFTGQGSQYLNMAMKLAEKYPIVADTFAEAERTLEKELDKPLREYIKRNLEMPEAEQFAALQNTAISQPATLTVDIAIMRLLQSYGIKADMVAGHSLGEYAAAVAAEIMPFEDALVAVCARGREMASVKIDDPGKMASISASPAEIEPILNEIPGYVVAANKNCAQQTVIAGESAAIEIAIKRFKAEKYRVHPLPVSHAFHSKIVSPASVPLKRVLERLRIQPPTRPITTNVTGDWYPQTREEIIDLLAKQVASPVEWLIVETLYAAGARIFIECGPKRA